MHAASEQLVKAIIQTKPRTDWSILEIVGKSKEEVAERIMKMPVERV
jgi:hypothetical protein